MMKFYFNAIKKAIFILLLLPSLGFGQLSGEFVISTGHQTSNFKSLAAAIAHVNTVGVSGPVTFLLDENQTVTSQIEIKQFPGSSALNTLTIKPNVGKNVIISGDINQGCILAFNNATYVTIDGNNSSADNMLTIHNKNNFGYDQRSGVQLYNGSSNNKIQNLKVNLEIGGITTGILSVGIFAGGKSLGSNGNNPNNTIKNVSFTNVKQAIMVMGLDTNNKDWNILNNTIKSTDDNTKAFLGIYILNANNFTVSGNAISGIKLPAGLNGGSFHSGLYLENANNSFISKNSISNIQNSASYAVGYGVFIKGDYNQVNGNSIKNLDSNSSTDGSYGIRSTGNNTSIYNNDIANVFSSLDKNTNGIYVSGNNQLVYNNFVNDVKSAGGGDPSSQSGYGIYINGGSSVKLYYNTVELKTNQTTGVSAALFIKGGSKLDIRNNIFINKQTAATRFAIYSAIPSGSFDFLNYNNYLSTQYVGSLGDHNNVQNIKATLANWQTATGKDEKSINIVPVFVSNADLHLDKNSNSALKAGAPIPAVITDIDGDTRDGNQPYMGADEISCVLPAPAGQITGSATICAGKTVTYSVQSVSNATSYTWSYSGTGATITNGTANSPTITFSANATSGKLTVKGINSCGEGVVSTLDIAVNSYPTPTFTTAIQNHTCGDLHIWYETQVGKYNYVWEVSGTKDVDYKLIDKGTNDSHQIVIEWLTAGPKTVKVNYSNTVGGCKGVTPAIYSTQVLITDQGRVKGGGDFCVGAPLPLLTLYGLNGNDIPYSDASLVLKWQYSDDLHNENWIDIPETKGKVTYTPAVFPGAFRTFRAFLQNGLCSKTAIETRVTIIPVSTPTIGMVTQPTCLSSISSVVLNGLPISGTISQTGTVNATYSIVAGGTQTIRDLSPGTYRFAVTSGSCTSIKSADVVINPVTNTWNGSSWSDAGKMPTLNQAIIFDGDFTSTQDLEGCSCTVNTGKKVVFKSVEDSSGPVLRIANKVEVLGTGTLIMENNTNLQQLNDSAINIGKINVEKIFNFVAPPDPKQNRQQYNYVSSPVLGGILKNIYSGNAAALYHNESTNTFATSSGANIMGRALALQEPSIDAVPTNVVTATFTGVPFNGVLEYPLAYTTTKAGVSHGFNLVGNPYPSNLDLHMLYEYVNGTDKNADKIETTIRFWDNRGNTEFKQKGSGYTGESYAKYNIISDTGLPAATASLNSQDSLKLPTQFVSVGTGFMVRAKAGANGKNLVFNNNMRTGKVAHSYTGKKSERDKFYIRLRTPANLQVMSAVVYFEDATNGIGPEDTETSVTSDGIYSVVDGSKLAIQGRSLFNIEDSVPLGASFFTAGSYTISLPIRHGVFAETQKVYLKDNITGIITSLSEGDYTFNATAGQSTGRFEIIYRPDTVLSTVGAGKGKDIIIYREGEGLVVKASSDKITSLDLYDMSGRLLSKAKPNSINAVINAEGLVDGVYILHIQQKGRTTIKKILK